MKAILNVIWMSVALVLTGLVVFAQDNAFPDYDEWRKIVTRAEEAIENAEEQQASMSEQAQETVEDSQENGQQAREEALEKAEAKQQEPVQKAAAAEKKWWRFWSE